MFRLPRLKLAAALLAVLAPLYAAPGEDRAGEDAPARAQVGLFTTLPLFWGEAKGLSDLIAPDAKRHWARAAIERDYQLVPLDVLAGEGAHIHELGYLLLAQPRMLSPAENVALDAWARDGGRLLLFADPMLTGESVFPIGDKRRPQDVALLSPILRHWGLELRFDEDQERGERLADAGDFAVPMDVAGRFSFLPPDEPDTACIPRSGGLIADCTIGKGRAVIVADAALFDGPGGDPVHERALHELLASAFGR